MLTQIFELALLCVVQLCALDDDCMRRQIDAPGQRGGCTQHLSVSYTASGMSRNSHASSGEGI